MIFKRLSFEQIQFDDHDVEEIKSVIADNLARQPFPMQDVIAKSKQKIKKFQRSKDCMLRDAVTALAVCHNVTPVLDEGKRVFQASSPDEISLV